MTQKTRHKSIKKDKKFQEFATQTLTTKTAVTTNHTAINSFFKYKKITPTQYLQTTQNIQKDIENWKKHLQKENKTPKTIQRYETKLKRFLIFHKKITKPKPKKYVYDDLKTNTLISNFFFKKNLKRPTEINYLKSITSFTKTINKTIDEVIEEAKIEQRARIVNNIIIEPNPNESKLNNYMIQWVQKLQTENLKQITQHTLMYHLRAFLKFYGVNLPDTITFETKTSEWYLLDKKMIEICIKDGNPFEKALYSFMASTGIRISDVKNFTIQDFMEATKDYHNCNNVYDFIHQAPRNMMGFWEFYPQKTAKTNIECKIFNSPESSNYLIEYLKFRDAKIKKKNEVEDLDLKLSKKDPLFSPYRRNIGAKYSINGLNAFFKERKKFIYNIELNKLKNKLKTGEIDQETYNDLIEKIPKFTPHQLRKYAASVFANHNTNVRISALFEGHVPPLKNDVSYIKINKEVLQDAYYECLEDLSFEKTEVNKVTTADKLKLDELIRKAQYIVENTHIEDNQTISIAEKFL